MVGSSRCAMQWSKIVFLLDINAIARVAYTMTWRLKYSRFEWSSWCRIWLGIFQGASSAMLCKMPWRFNSDAQLFGGSSRIRLLIARISPKYTFYLGVRASTWQTRVRLVLKYQLNEEISQWLIIFNVGNLTLKYKSKYIQDMTSIFLHDSYIGKYELQ